MKIHTLHNADTEILFYNVDSNEKGKFLTKMLANL